MIRKSWLIGIMFVLLLAISVFGSSTAKVEIEQEKSDIFLNETAVFYLDIENIATSDHDYTISVPEIDWIGYTDPLSDYIFSIDARKTKKIKLVIKPKPSLEPGPYLVKTVIKDKSRDETTEVLLPIYLKDASKIRMFYSPSLSFIIDMDQNLDPRREWNIDLIINNLNPKKIDGFNITVQTELFTEKRTINIKPNEKTVQSFDRKLSDLNPPVNDTIIFDMHYYDAENNKTYFWKEEKQYNVMAYKQFEKSVEEHSSFLGEDVTIYVSNNGNIKGTFEVREKIGTFKSWFTASTIKPAVLKTDDGLYYVWNLEIEPENVAELTYSTDYKPLFYFIIILVLSLVFYFILRSPLVVKKDVVTLAMEEGGISSLKIIIHVRNRSSKIFENIRIIEKIPHIVNVDEEFEMGTMAPVKVVQGGKKGSLVKWEFSHLDPYEERIITYKLYSKLSILGGLSLPHTLLKFQDKKGREMTIKSNRLNLEI